MRFFTISNFDCTNSVGLLVELSELVKGHYLCVCFCACMLARVCLVPVTGLYLIIIKHHDAGAGTELWCDEVKNSEQRKWRENKQNKVVFSVGWCRRARWLSLSVSRKVLIHRQAHRTQPRWKGLSSFRGNSHNDKVFFPVIVNFTVSGWMGGIFRVISVAEVAEAVKWMTQLSVTKALTERFGQAIRLYSV